MNNQIMKLTALALACGFALFSSTFALANTNQRQSVARNHRGTVGMVHPHPNYRHPSGPTTFGETGRDYAVPGWSEQQTQYWIDNATGPKD
jgi:hypothetical protein